MWACPSVRSTRPSGRVVGTRSVCAHTHALHTRELKQSLHPSRSLSHRSRHTDGTALPCFPTIPIAIGTGLRNEVTKDLRRDCSSVSYTFFALRNVSASNRAQRDIAPGHFSQRPPSKSVVCVPQTTGKCMAHINSLSLRGQGELIFFSATSLLHVLPPPETLRKKGSNYILLRKANYRSNKKLPSLPPKPWRIFSRRAKSAGSGTVSATWTRPARPRRAIPTK